MKCKICDKAIPNKRKYCSNKCKFSDKEYNQSRISSIKNDILKKVKCKFCKWESKDILNKSGVIKKHLLTHLIRFDKQTYMDYFESIELPEIKVLICPICKYSTKDLNNKSGIFTRHIKQCHNKNVGEFLLEYPVYNYLWQLYQRNENRKVFLNSDESNFVECKICKEKLKIISNTHLQKHNITPEQYKEKHGDLISTNLKTIFSKNLSDVEFSYCSSYEKEIEEFLVNNGIHNIIKNTKKIIYPYQLDIFIPEFNYAIEFNGLFFHSELGAERTKHYHVNKTELCERNNIKLIQIFQDEWNSSKNIIKNKILSDLKLYKISKIYARNCDIKEVDNKIKSEFLNKYHLQKNDKSKIKLGLYYNHDLISIATFSLPRIAVGNKNENNSEYELSRFCTKENVVCVGGLSKLLSNFVKNYNPSKIISYADRRYSSSLHNVYISCGFKFVKYTPPNYFYTKDYNTRLHRFNFPKHKLVSNFNQDPSKTEWEIMQNLGYDRIWDCGHLKYEMVFI